MAGLTPDGFEGKTLEEIEAGFVTQQRATIDVGIDTSPTGLVGQLNGIMASEIAQLWELGLELYDAMDPDKAVGAQQDALYSLTNTLRRGALRSSVLATVVLQPGTNIAIGDAQASVFGNSSAKFENAEPMINASFVAANVPVRFEAGQSGPVIANAGTLTVIETPLIGWDSITNDLDATVGAEIESNVAYRVRRDQELAAQGGGSVPAIRSDLLKIATVRAATVIENTTAVAANGLPPNSFEAVVRSDGADDDQAIAETIWANKPGGIESYGTVTRVVTDSEGVDHTVKFSRPVERPVYVALRITTNPLVYGGDAAAKTALVAAAEDPAAVGYLDVGADVYAGRLIAAGMALSGVLNVDARLSFSPILDFASAATALVIGQREVAALDTSRITIAPFP